MCVCCCVLYIYTFQKEPSPVPGVSLEEAEEMRSTIASLETQLRDTLTQLADKEDSEKKMCELHSAT